MNRIRLCLRVTAALKASHRYMPAAALPSHNILTAQAAIGRNNNNNCSQELSTCRFYGNLAETEYVVDSITYDRVCSETLDALSDYFDELIENATEIAGSDVAYSDGVLSVNLGPANGSYVINRQKPNKQIWLSSPTSGPKRFDYVLAPGQANGQWIYKHTGQTLHELLQTEISQILKGQPVNFIGLP